MHTPLKPTPRTVNHDIAITSHVKPKTLSDKIAYSFVRFLRFFADKFFANGRRVMAAFNRAAENAR
jgi:ubiquinol oxidase